jgi:hypothetical protein
MASFRSLRDRALAYGMYGGTPHYLSNIRTGQSLARNVARSILSPRGEVRLLALCDLEATTRLMSLIVPDSVGNPVDPCKRLSTASSGVGVT